MPMNMLPIKACQKLQLKAHDVPLVLADAGLVNCEVLVDGSWQKQGHSSLNGVVTAMSDGKCLVMFMFYLNIVKDVEFGNRKKTNQSMKNGKLPISVI